MSPGIPKSPLRNTAHRVHSGWTPWTRHLSPRAGRGWGGRAPVGPATAASVEVAARTPHAGRRRPTWAKHGLSLAAPRREPQLMARRLRWRSHEIEEISTTTGKERQAGFA